MNELIKYIIILALCIGVAAIIDHNRKASHKKHNPSHPGISENGRYIICPKCKSPYCEYVFEQNKTEVTTVRYRPLHPLKPFKETTREVPDLFPVRKYRCKNCGWIFK